MIHCRPEYFNREMIQIKIGPAYLLHNSNVYGDFRYVYTVKFGKADIYKKSVMVLAEINKYREMASITERDVVESFESKHQETFVKEYFFPGSLSSIEPGSFSVPAFCVVGKNEFYATLMGSEYRDSLGYDFLVLNDIKFYEDNVRDYLDALDFYGKNEITINYCMPRKDFYSTQILEVTGLKWNESHN